MNILSKTVKGIMQKARRRVTAFQKAFKNKNLDKTKTNYYNDFQDFLKNSNKKFRRYNRKIGAYEPITPRGKLRQSEEFEQFVLDINEYINTSRTAQEEVERQVIAKQYNLNDDFLELMDVEGMLPSEYSSDSDHVKQLHLLNAEHMYLDNFENVSIEQIRQINDIGAHIGAYDIKQIYDAVFHILNTTNEGTVFNEI